MSVVVVGCGLVGTSAALALTAAGRQVHLEDVDPDHVELAVSLGAGVAEAASDPTLVIVAVPPRATIDAVRDALERFGSAVVVTDVASVKSPVCSAIDDPRFVGGHPMAGKERSGPLAASAQLFEGRPWAIVPTEFSSAEAITAVEDAAVATGAVLRRFDAAGHDRAVGLVSHIPYLVSVLMAGLLRDAPDEHLELAGQGLRDVTRVAGSDTSLWVDILSTNHDSLKGPLRQLRLDLDAILTEGAEPETAPGTSPGEGTGIFAPVLDRGVEGTRRIPGKHGERPRDLTSVYVPIDDTPGQLSKLVGECGDAGINIEDLRIDHEYQRAAGLVEIVVVPSSAHHLVNSLTAHGWAAYL